MSEIEPSDETYRALFDNGLTAGVAWYIATLEARVATLEARLRDAEARQP